MSLETTTADETDTVASEASIQSSSSSSSYNYIGMYLSLPIFFIGVVGNLLTVFVMKRRVFQNTATAVYLISLAVTDTCLLVTGIPHEWLEWFSIDMDPWPCRFHRFLFYTSSDVSIWTVALFTFDRFVAVCFPLQKRIFCTSRRASVAFAVIVISWSTKNLHVFWTRGEEYVDSVLYRKCGYINEYAYFEYFVRPWIVLVLIMLLPFCIVLTLNSLIVNALLRSQRLNNSNAVQNMRNNPFRQATAMCLSISFTLLICIAPSIVLSIGKPYWKSIGSENTAYDIAKIVNNELVYFNHAINFCLYCMTGERFRSELCTLVRRSKTDSIQSSTQVTSLTRAICMSNC